jgi:hypothetical protein
MTIQINGQALVLPDGTSLSFDRENPAMNYEVIKDSLALGLTVPALENADLFKHAQRVGVVDRVSIFSAVIQDQGVVIPGAMILVENADLIGSQATISFSVIMNGFGVELLDKSLRDFDLGTIDLGAQGNQPAAAKALSEEAVGRVRFPTYFNDQHYDGKNPEWGPLHSDLLAFVNRYEGGAYRMNEDSPERWSSDAISPWPNLLYVLRAIFASFGYTLTGNYFSALPEAAEILIQSSLTLDRLTNYKGLQVKESALVSIPVDMTYQDLGWDTVVHNDHGLWSGPLLFQYALGDLTHIYSVSGEFFLEASGTIDTWHIDFLIEYPGTTIGHHFFTLEADGVLQGQWARFYVDSSIMVAAADLGLDFKIQARRRSTGTGAITTLELRNLQLKIYPKYYAGFNEYQKELVVNQHVPDISVKDLLLELRKMGADILPDPFTKTLGIFLSEDLTKGGALDLPGVQGDVSIDYLPAQHFKLQASLTVATEGEIPASWLTTDVINGLWLTSPILQAGIYVLETSTHRVFLTTGELFAPFDFQFYYMPAHYIGKEGKEVDISPSFELLGMQNFDTNAMTGASDPEHLWLLPTLEEKGSSTAFPNGFQKFEKLRLAIWRGFYNDGHRTYPMATSFNKDRNGVAVGDVSLDVGDPLNGIARFTFPLLERLTKEERITVSCLLSPTQAKAISPRAPVIWNGKKMAIRTVPMILDGDQEHIHEIECTLL